jgi:transcriptional regulator of acetoin/glycerol metabolism
MQTGQTEKGQRPTSDGKAWLIQGSPVFDEQGNITGAVEVTLEMTQRK